jgi:hypothetical protein
MSTPEHVQGEQHSSVAISQNAKGEAQVTVKAYSHDLDTLDAARVKAVQIYKATVAEVRP